MNILKTCLLFGLVLTISSAPNQCSSGGIGSATGTCIYPSYIQGCSLYSSSTSCAQCQYNYIKSGSICIYSPSVDNTNCCRTFIYPSGQCSECSTGLVLIDGKCKDKKIVGCLLKNKLGTCLNCAIDYILFGGQCFKKIVGCNKYSSIGICQSCEKGYQYIQNKSYCIPNIIIDQICKYPWILSSNSNSNSNNNNDCIIPGCQIQYDYGCAQCLSSYKLLPDGSCRPGTIQGCLQYTSDGYCVQCKKPLYTQYKGYCLIYGCVKINQQNGRCSNCDNNKGYQLTNDGYCKIINCLVSSINQNKCLVCQDGYIQTRNGCQKQNINKICTICTKGYYLSQNGQCKNKQPGCINYNKYKCSACQQNLYLSRQYQCIPRQAGCIYNNGLCTDCISPFKHKQNNKCLIQGCQQYYYSSLSLGCRKCIKPYILTQSNTCTYQNCNQVINSRCISCIQGYRINNDGYCYILDQYCKAYDFNGRCIQCKLGYYIDRYDKIGGNGGVLKCKQQKYGCNYIDGRCTSCRAPFNYNSNTQLCQIDGCLTYFLGGCKICDGLYDLRYNSCKLPNCLISYKGHCKQCDPNYIMKSDGTCVNKDQFCWKYDTNGQCIQCSPQYYLSKLTKKCQPREPGCLYNDNDKCYKCDKPFYFDGIRCQIYGCMKLLSKGCQICYYPMQVNKQGLCNIVNCDRMDGQKCMICKPGYTIVNDGSCQLEDSKCLVYGDKGCKKCIKGYKLDKYNKCQYADQHCWDFSEKGHCTNCDRLYFLNVWNKCQIKDTNCLAYSGGRCIECKNYYYLHRGLCYPNAKGCLQQKNIKQCIKCQNGYKLDYGTCTPSITRLTWDSINMDFWTSDNDQDLQISKDVFSIGKTNKLNLDGAIIKGKGKILYSSIIKNRKSIQVDDDTDINGWTPQNKKYGQFLGILLQKMQTFYAIDIKYIQGNTLTKFAIEQSDDGITYNRINQFIITKSIPNTVQTFYYTPVHARSVRLIVLEGIPNIKVQFYYSNGQNIYQTQTKTYIEEQTQISILDSLRGEVFQTKGSCVDQELCWMGLELCEAKNIIGFSLMPNTGSKGTINAVSIKYSQDGVKFICYNDCKEVSLNQGTYRLNPRVTASKLRVYPTKWTGEPSYSVTFEY